jgi:hypothetical protein
MNEEQEKFDNKLMEQQIVSMLENVLNHDSDEEGINSKNSSNKNLNQCNENFLFLSGDELWSKAIKENQLAPKLFVNDVGFTQNFQPPAGKFKRKNKKSNTADACSNQNTLSINSNKARIVNGGYLGASLTQNISMNYRSNYNPMSFSPLESLQNYNSLNSTLT